MTLRDNHISASVPVTDMERAKKFYSEKLGLRPADVPAPATMNFEAGDGTTITLYQREHGTKADHTAAIWLVDDIEKTVNELRDKGVIFEHYDRQNLKTDKRGIANLGDSKAAWFKDTEGNILAVATA